MTTAHGTPPALWVAETVDELIDGARDRTPVSSSDAKSGAYFERLLLGGRACFLKILSPQSDWIMRCTGNTTHWEFQTWRAGLYHRVPAVIDHAMLGMALEHTETGSRLAMLMADRGADLVPPGDDLIAESHHLDFLDHMAAMHAAGLGWRDELGLCSMTGRFRWFAPDTIAPELQAAEVPQPIQVADRGWRELPRRAPELAELTTSIHAAPEPLADALAATPQTFIAGDWKLGNLGRRADGRTVLLDWAYPGAAPPGWELTWYLALNRARIPISKEASIEHFRQRLETHGMATSEWWDRQFGLCCVGMMATLAWEKAVGDEDELRWWSRAAVAGAAWLS